MALCAMKTLFLTCKILQGSLMPSTSSTSYEYVPVKDIMIEKSLYRTLTKLKYSMGGADEEETSISSIINDMLKEYLHTYVLSKKMGHMLLSKDIVRVAINDMTEEQITEASIANAIRYKEGAILEYGRPSLSAYLELIRAFAKANKFEMEISKNPENDSQVLIISFRLGDRFTRFKADTYKILIEEFAEINKLETTNTSIYIEYKPKKEQQQIVKEAMKI